MPLFIWLICLLWTCLTCGYFPVEEYTILARCYAKAPKVCMYIAQYMRPKPLAAAPDEVDQLSSSAQTSRLSILDTLQPRSCLYRATVLASEMTGSWADLFVLRCQSSLMLSKSNFRFHLMPPFHHRGFIPHCFLCPIATILVQSHQLISATTPAIRKPIAVNNNQLSPIQKMNLASSPCQLLPTKVLKKLQGF